MSPSSPPGHSTHLIPNPPPQPPKIYLDPVDLDFGTMAPNTSKTLQTSVCNCGSQQLHWSTGGGGLEVKPSKGTLDSNQPQPIKVTLNTGSLRLNRGPNMLLVRFNSSDGNFIDLKVTVTLKSRLLPKWTGLGDYISPSHPKQTEFQRGKTLWDALTLLLLPLILTGGVIYFGMRQNQDNYNLTQNQFHIAATQYVNDKSIAATRYANDLNLAATRYANDQQLALESTFQTYLDRMTDLITNPHVHESSPLGDDLRSMATARTLTILPDLSVSRKATVLKFLHDAGLIKRPNDPNIKDPVVNLNGADFSGVDLSGFVLGGANLPFVHFHKTNLTRADLSSAYLAGADLTRANLRFAQLYSPQQTVDLTGAKLVNADLTGANFIQAKLTNADLTGATVTNADFTHVIWSNTICPNGNKSEANGSNSCVGH